MLSLKATLEMARFHLGIVGRGAGVPKGRRLAPKVPARSEGPSLGSVQAGLNLSNCSR